MKIQWVAWPNDWIVSFFIFVIDGCLKTSISFMVYKYIPPVVNLNLNFDRYNQPDIEIKSIFVMVYSMFGTFRYDSRWRRKSLFRDYLKFSHLRRFPPLINELQELFQLKLQRQKIWLWVFWNQQFNVLSLVGGKLKIINELNKLSELTQLGNSGST